MRSAIIDKLSTHMGDCPQTEPDVVYALVQIRKLLDLADKKGQYDQLRFMCNWVVHPKMDRSPANGFLQTLEDRLVGIPLLEFDRLDSDGKAGDFLSLGSFREEFLHFCEANGLKAKWADSTESWRRFLALYARIVKDCPLEITPTKPVRRTVPPNESKPRRRLRRVMLTDSDETERFIEEPQPGKVVLSLTWELTLNDGTSSKWGYNLVLPD